MWVVRRGAALVLAAGLTVLARIGGHASAAEPVRFPYQDLLAGRTVILDPGHGGWDPGATTPAAREADINVAVAEQLRAWLVAAGARVLMTWSASAPIHPQKKYRVRERVSWINRQDASVLIDIHTNAGAGGRGPQLFYWEGAPSRMLADDIASELWSFTRTHREVTRIDQYVLRHSRFPAVNVEVGFISNRSEAQHLTTPSYQRDLAWCVFVGIARWFVAGYQPAAYLAPPPATDLLRR